MDARGSPASRSFYGLQTEVASFDAPRGLRDLSRGLRGGFFAYPSGLSRAQLFAGLSSWPGAPARASNHALSLILTDATAASAQASSPPPPPLSKCISRRTNFEVSRPADRESELTTLTAKRNVGACAQHRTEGGYWLGRSISSFNSSPGWIRPRKLSVSGKASFATSSPSKLTLPTP